MKPDRLDFAVFIIVALCLAGVLAVAYVSDPGRQPARVAYLYPALGATQNVWLAAVNNPEDKRQLTFSEHGVFDFDISQDGRWLAYAERSDDRSVVLRLLDMPSGTTRELAGCAAAMALCSSPVFSPDGKMLAYQRAEALGGSFGLSRIWLVDLISANYDSFPLIGDTQVVGHSPRWSGDSNTVAFYSADSTQPGILLYDIVPRDAEARLKFIPSAHGTMGALSPSGRQVIFPDLVFRDDQFFSHLQIADLAKREFAAFTDADGPIDDVAAQFSPDGSTVAIARRYTDSRWTPGHQVYLRAFDAPADDWRAVAYDPDYNTSYFRWDFSGTRLVMQRFPLYADASGEPAKPEVWAHDLNSGETLKIVTDAYLPQWLRG